MNFNYRLTINIIGTLLLINGFFMLTCIPFSFYYEEGDILPLLTSFLITSLVGFLMWLLTRKHPNKELNKRDGYLVVTFGWLSMALFGTLPYLLSGSINNFTDAFFETLSGFSTTGATILVDIESVHKGILFWRSLTQWVGGMGIIVLTVAILPLLGIGGMQLFVAEAPGISPDKLQPRIKETAKRLWLVYMLLTAAEFLLLWIGGMSFFDAINHSLTTMATGGFSTKNASIAYFNSPFIQYVIIIFMVLAGTNFTVTYLLLHRKFKGVVNNEEFKYYVFFMLTLGLLVGGALYALDNSGDLEESIRLGLFQVVSVVTTTGYITGDFTAWSSFITVIFLILMFVGASSGSTSGGVKVVRHLLLIKNSFAELKRQVHSNAIIPVRLNQKSVSKDIIFNVLAFLFIYIIIFAIGAVVMGLLGADFNTAIGSVATCLGNIGPGLGDVGPVNNFSTISTPGKWVLSFLMLVGRLELFTVLVLLTPSFWKY